MPSRLERVLQDSRGSMAKDLRINKTGVVVLASVGAFVLLLLLYHMHGNYSKSGYDQRFVKISELLSASIDLAERGGAEIVRIRKLTDEELGRESKGKTVEGAQEFVTMGDQHSHDIIVSGLLKAWPGLPYVSEEMDRELISIAPPMLNNPEVIKIAGRNERVPLEEVTVWIDPLDATMEYTQGRDDPSLLRYVTVMVCIAVNKVPIAGVIHQPYERAEDGAAVTKWAWVDHGISVSLLGAVQSSHSDGDKVRVITSRSHPGEVVEIAKKAFSGKKEVEQISAAGAGYKVLAVAENAADLYLHTTAIKKWDICAGNALLNAVGGKMTTREGVEIFYGKEGNPKNDFGLVVARSDERHAEYLNLFKL